MTVPRLSPQAHPLWSYRGTTHITSTASSCCASMLNSCGAWLLRPPTTHTTHNTHHPHNKHTPGDPFTCLVYMHIPYRRCHGHTQRCMPYARRPPSQGQPGKPPTTHAQRALMTCAAQIPRWHSTFKRRGPCHHQPINTMCNNSGSVSAGSPPPHDITNIKNTTAWGRRALPLPVIAASNGGHSVMQAQQASCQQSSVITSRRMSASKRHWPPPLLAYQYQAEAGQEPCCVHNSQDFQTNT